MGDWTNDPGPCPVDDTPHTACTPASVAAQIIVRSREPQTCTVIVQPPRVFTTATYRRALHAHPPDAQVVPLPAIRHPAPPAAPPPRARKPAPAVPTPRRGRR